MDLIAAHLNASHSGGDSVAIGIYSSLFPDLHIIRDGEKEGRGFPPSPSP